MSKPEKRDSISVITINERSRGQKQRVTLPLSSNEASILRDKRHRSKPRHLPPTIPESETDEPPNEEVAAKPFDKRGEHDRGSKISKKSAGSTRRSSVASKKSGIDNGAFEGPRGGLPLRPASSVSVPSSTRDPSEHSLQ